MAYPKIRMSAVAEQPKQTDVVRPPSSVFYDAPFMLVMIVVNVAVFVGEVAFAMMQTSDATGASRGLAALLEIPQPVAMAFGANYASATLYDGRVDTLVASCFVHWSILHIAFNMYALRAIGPFLERIVGTGRVALMYIGSGIVGSMFSTLDGWYSQQERVGAGASGAICGIIGAALVVGYRTAGWQSPLLRMTARWLGLTILVGFVAKFDNAAHIGGALSGGVIALLWKRGPEEPFARTLGIGVSAGLIVATLATVVVRDRRDPFAAMTMAERIQSAQLAARHGDCDKAWSAALSARRVARRDPATLRAIYLVRSACGIPDEA
ncbi:MAG: rhomboid family intramembrane serine protease [Polyangiaceae bacterium]